MPTQITLYPGAFTSPALFQELEAIIDGLSQVPGPVSESLMASIEVNVFKDNLKDIEEVPFVLMEGFVDFAKKFHERHPQFVFFASLRNRFYLDFVTALSGNLTAVQKGDDGIIYANGTAYFEIAEGEIELFTAFAGSRTDSVEHALQVHELDLREYLHLI